MKPINLFRAAAAALHKHRSVAARIMRKIEHYARTGSGDVKRLVGSTSLRLRVGDFRVIFEEGAAIHVIDVGRAAAIYE